MIVGIIGGVILGALAACLGIYQWIKEIGNMHKATPLDYMTKSEQQEFYANQKTKFENLCFPKAEQEHEDKRS